MADMCFLPQHILYRLKQYTDLLRNYEILMHPVEFTGSRFLPAVEMTAD